MRKRIDWNQRKQALKLAENVFISEEKYSTKQYSLAIKYLYNNYNTLESASVSISKNKCSFKQFNQTLDQRLKSLERKRLKKKKV